MVLLLGGADEDTREGHLGAELAKEGLLQLHMARTFGRPLSRDQKYEGCTLGVGAIFWVTHWSAGQIGS